MEVRDITMDFQYGEAFTEASPEAYERLVLDVLLGDKTLSPTRQRSRPVGRGRPPGGRVGRVRNQAARYRAGEWGATVRHRTTAPGRPSWRRA